MVLGLEATILKVSWTLRPGDGTLLATVPRGAAGEGAARWPEARPWLASLPSGSFWS